MADETSETSETSKGAPDAVGSVGNAFIFNTTPQAAAQLILNGTFVSTIAAAAVQSGNYVPAFVKVARVQASSTQTGTFADTNVFEFGGNQNRFYTVNLPPSTYPYANDVLIYVFDAYILISDTNGDNLQYVPSGPSFENPGTPTSLGSGGQK